MSQSVNKVCRTKYWIYSDFVEAFRINTEYLSLFGLNYSNSRKVRIIRSNTTQSVNKYRDTFNDDNLKMYYGFWCVMIPWKWIAVVDELKIVVEIEKPIFVSWIRFKFYRNHDITGRGWVSLQCSVPGPVMKISLNKVPPNLVLTDVISGDWWRDTQSWRYHLFDMERWLWSTENRTKKLRKCPTWNRVR